MHFRAANEKLTAGGPRGREGLPNASLKLANNGNAVRHQASFSGPRNEISGGMHTINAPVDNVLWVKVSGKLSREEYAELVPSWEQMIARHGKLRLLFEMEPGFTGWEPGAAWDDVKFSVAHRNELERVALVGGKKWEEWVTRLGALLVNAQVRFFDSAHAEDALKWLQE